MIKMIRIFLGNIGSGKTAACVRELMINPTQRYTVSNIITKGIKNNIVIKPEWIVKKDVIGHKKNGEEIYKLKVNREFWEKLSKKHNTLNVVIDEAHTILDSRRSMSTVSKCMNDWLSLLRRVLGKSPAGYGTLTLISQIDRRIDVNARELSTEIRYHMCHYSKRCKKCGLYWGENNETPDPLYTCPQCNSSRVEQFNFIIEVWHFTSMENYQAWKDFKAKTYYKHYNIMDIEKYFKHYNTLQWENLIVDF